MLGKRNSLYKTYSKHAAILNAMPYDCEVVNTGSTPSYKAFDYEYWEIKGFNLGFQPQPLYYDFETLKKFSNHIASKAKILICVEEFKLFVDAYPDEKTDYKYYLWLDEGQVRTYNKKKDWLMNYAPVFLYPDAALYDIKQSIKKIIGKEKGTDAYEYRISEEADIDCAQKWINCWSKEFGWGDRQIIRTEQKNAISANEKRLNDMIDYCFSHGWQAYLVVPPFSPNLTRLLDDEVLRMGLWEPLNRVSKAKDVELYNYYFDKRLADFRFYADALTLNDKGQKLFNEFVQQDIGGH